MKKPWVIVAACIVVIIGLFSFFGQKSNEPVQDKAANAPSAGSGNANAEPADQPKAGGTLVVGLGKEPGNPNPMIATISTGQFVKEVAYESLLTEDEVGRLQPLLAESWEVSPDAKDITLRLRKGVKFHDGKEMKADDVVWSANHVKDPQNAAGGQNLIKDVQVIEKVDDYTVKFKLANPSITFLNHLANIIMLPIIPANSLQPGQIKLEPNKFVPGTGAFKFEKFDSGSEVIATKFPDYWGKPAYLDQITFRSIPDASTRFNALRTGGVHMADRLATLDVQRVQKGDVKDISILEEPTGGFQHLLMNYSRPLLQKREMRQALNLAIDKEQLVEEVFFGSSKATDLMMPPESIWAKAANLPPHKRDIEKAKQLLQAANYRGEELVLIGVKNKTQLLESFQRMLGEAGIRSKVEVLETGVMNERVRQGQYDLYIDGANINTDPFITMVPDYYTNKVEPSRYSNPVVDRLFDQLDDETDEKKRLDIFKELAAILDEDVANIPLFFEARFIGMSSKVQNYGPPQNLPYSESAHYFKQTWLK